MSWVIYTSPQIWGQQKLPCVLWGVLPDSHTEYLKSFPFSSGFIPFLVYEIPSAAVQLTKDARLGSEGISDASGGC